MTVARGKVTASVVVPLATSLEEANVLTLIAHHYERVMGITRHVVVWTAPRHVRRKYKFIVQESNRLEQVADTHLRDLEGEQEADSAELKLSLTDGTAFLGRLLSNLNSRRSRRRLSEREVEVRQALTSKLVELLLPLWLDQSVEFQDALQSRRRSELGWITQALEEAQRAST